jgi:hypothetical protein
MSRPLKALKASLLMLARRLRRFLRLSLEKPLTLSRMPPLRRLLVYKDHAHQRTKLLIRLSRAALMRTVHERSVDKRRTLIQVRSKST